MTTLTLLSQLRDLGVKLWIEGERLRYSAPQGALTADLRQRVGEQRAEIIAFLRQSQARPRSAATSILPAKRNGKAPLSFSQERLWFLHQLDPGNPVYNAPGAALLEGPLNLSALEQSLAEILRRHEVLTSTFIVEDGSPLQVINLTHCFSLKTADVESLPHNEQQRAGDILAAKEASRGFDLESGPLLRVSVVRFNPEAHLVLFTMHHIVSDGWSMGVLMREVAALYHAYSAGEPSPLPELKIQYSDYAVWQREWLQGETLRAELGYWREKLGSNPPALELPLDKPRPALQSYKGDSFEFVVPEATAGAIKALSRREGVSNFMSLLAAFEALLRLYTKQEAILVGTSIANRNRAEIEELIGFFTNILVLKTDVGSELSFLELLGRVRDMLLGAYAHQDLPFEKLVEELQPNRSLDKTPIVQVGFTFQNAPMQALDLPGLAIRPHKVRNETAKFDLTLVMWETAEGFSGAFEYNTDLFYSSSIERMAEDLLQALRAMAADPTRSIADLQTLIERAPSRKTGTRSTADEFDELCRRSNLTRNQLLMRMGQKLQPDVPLYNMISTYLLEGDIDLTLFDQAFNQVVESSDALRTVVEENDDVPYQRVLDAIEYEMLHLDFSDRKDPLEEARAWAQQRGQAPFKLDQCCFEAALIKLSDDRFFWFVNVHHLIVDLWAMWLILRRQDYFYRKAVAGEAAETSDFPPFKEYIEYEREFWNSPQYLEAENYWKQKLAEKIDPLAFYGRLPVRRTARVRRVACDLGIERAERLRAIAVEEGVFTKTLNVSIFNMFAAVLLTYVHRTSGNANLSLGTPFHNRMQENFKHVIGLFMEVLALRVSIDEKDTFYSLINKIGREASETLRHRLCAIGNPTKNKAYEIFLNYNSTPPLSFQGAPVKYEWFSPGFGSDSLALQVQDYGPSETMIMVFDFHRDIFDDRQQAQAIEHFIEVIDCFLAQPARLVRSVEILSAKEREQVLFGFNRTEAAYPRDRLVTDLFQDIAKSLPDSIALVYHDQLITYKALNAKANQLAHYLRALGAGPEVRVGICLERSAQMIIATLAVLKAGAAYVPLDSAYPKERLSGMLEDAQVGILITAEKLLDSLPRHPGRIVLLDSHSDEIETQSDEDLQRAVEADNLAYVIFTSGSTGRAKGVMVTHGSILNAFMAWKEAYKLEQAGESHLQMASFSFDVFTGDLVRSLCSGGKLVLCPWELLLDAEKLFDLMLREAVKVAEFVPVVVRSLIEHLKSIGASAEFMRLLIVGSDTWNLREYREVLKRCGDRTRLINSYGVAESTIDNSYFETDDGDLDGDRLTPIGRPFANNKIYLLDSQLRPVVIGMPGEMFIGGAGLARGYMNRADLTAERFIPNPFGLSAGDRLYETGDLAQYLPDGNIEFLGRIDSQVKIRGFRIEPAEIEAALVEHPSIKHAVVIAREDHPGQKYLAAYLVAEPGEACASSEIRNFLRQRLAEFMIPTSIVALESLPTTPNGKVDRKALPKPDEAKAEHEAKYAAPRNEIERAIAVVWQEVLQVEMVSIHDNFFDLGGHSMLVIQVHKKLGQSLGAQLSIIDLFKYPTVGSLAAHISDASESKAAQPNSQEQGERFKRARGRMQRQLKLAQGAAKESEGEKNVSI